MVITQAAGEENTSVIEVELVEVKYVLKKICCNWSSSGEGGGEEAPWPRDDRDRLCFPELRQNSF